MKLNLNSVSIRLLLFITILFGCIIAFIYTFQFLPVHKQLADASLAEKLNIITGQYQNSLSSALKASDDVTVLNSIDAIIKFDGVTDAYIVDKTGKVLTHNKTSEWGKVYTDPLTKTAAASVSRRIQNTGKDNEYLFSVPLGSSATLCVGLTKERAEKNLEAIKNEYLFTSLTVYLITVVMIYLILNTLFISKFKSLTRLTDSVALSKGRTIPYISKDEFGEITAKINALLSNQTNSSQINAGTLCPDSRNILLLMNHIIKDLPSGILVIDSENRIAAINKPFQDLLGITDPDLTGRHLLDLVSIPELFELIAKATENSGSTIIGIVKGKQMKVRSIVNEKKEIAGEILFL